jgi:hypothetical protein
MASRGYGRRAELLGHLSILVRRAWSEAADAANEGLNGQGYIVHVVMLASRKADELGWWVI